MLILIIGLAQALVVFRVVAAPLMSEGSWEFIGDHANTVAIMLGAVLHYLTIQIMTRVNRWVSLKLCHIEKTNSFAATERNFTVKMFTFQFFTLFSSLFYVAFFLGRYSVCNCLSVLSVSLIVHLHVRVSVHNCVSVCNGPSVLSVSLIVHLHVSVCP
ncbi:anoctamin-9-like [Anarrhichthys ocellatus]|uniref:anoctamin-9-like n=1 Tax=Anarrhichthys ocellatus TaxID=433405 RepID=UPI0012ECC37B|nr:anoctamin-9-like [Anarrhichthys ocellatus]